MISGTAGRAKEHAPEEWERTKRPFYDLYHKQKKTLSEVRQTLKHKENFDATHLHLQSLLESILHGSWPSLSLPTLSSDLSIASFPRTVLSTYYPATLDALFLVRLHLTGHADEISCGLGLLLVW